MWISRAEPEHDGRRRRLVAIALLAAIVVVAIAVALWLLARPPAEAPKGPPVGAARPHVPLAEGRRRRPPPSPRPARPRARGPSPAPRPRSPTLRVDADVPGANVFLDRKFLGTTPVETREFEPGPAPAQRVGRGLRDVRRDDRARRRVARGGGPLQGGPARRAASTSCTSTASAPAGAGSSRRPPACATRPTKAGDSFQAPFPSLEPLAGGLPEPQPAREAEGRQDLELHGGQRGRAARRSRRPSRRPARRM